MTHIFQYKMLKSIKIIASQNRTLLTLYMMVDDNSLLAAHIDGVVTELNYWLCLTYVIQIHHPST